MTSPVKKILLPVAAIAGLLLMVAWMAGLVMGQTTERRPAVLVRGLDSVPERDDDAPGMTAVAMPRGSEWRIAVYTILATLRLRLGSLLAFQRNPRRPEARR